VSAITDALWKEHPTDFFRLAERWSSRFMSSFSEASAQLSMCCWRGRFRPAHRLRKLANLLPGSSHPSRTRNSHARCSRSFPNPASCARSWWKIASLPLAGGLIGLLLAYWTPQILTTMRAANLPRLDQVGSIGTCLAFRLRLRCLPACSPESFQRWRMTKINLQMALQEGTRDFGQHRGIALVPGRFGDSVIANASSRRRSLGAKFAPAGQRALWLRPCHVLTLRVSPVGPRYTKDESSARIRCPRK